MLPAEGEEPTHIHITFLTKVRQSLFFAIFTLPRPTAHLYDPLYINVIRLCVSTCISVLLLMPTFTLNQKKAHDAERHISITANAGSGKTSVIVSRYCDLVEYRRYEPRDIAAITFTEKAAAELRSRIAREIDSRLGDKEHKTNWQRLKHVREKFPSAIVTTIHGFCSQMLREFPIECQVAPNFSVISGFERTDMEETALMEAIEQRLADDPAPEFKEAYDIARRIGREQMEGILRLMLRNRENIILSRRRGGLRLCREELLERWNNGIEGAIRSMTLNAETRPAIAMLIDFLKDDMASRARELLQSAERAETASEYLRDISELLSEILLNKSGDIRKRSYQITGDEVDILDGTAAVLKRTLKNAQDFLAADPDPAIHEQLYDDAQGLLKIFDRALLLYSQRKELVGGLDFEDLQLALFNALEREEPRERIAGRFKYIMVDEFQDTNELQYQVVRKMARELQDIDLICVVGDRKQSIYGFRGAEVEVFSRATEEIRKVNRDKSRGAHPLEYRLERIEPDTRDESLGEIHLDASFRLLPGICAFVNTVCGPIMGSTSSSEYGVEYEPLVCARGSPGQGEVEIILSKPEPKDSKDQGEETSVSEAELIACRVLEMVQKEEALVWEGSDESEEERARPVGFGDIAILCRKRKTFEDLERTLRAKGIPFLTNGSSGYFRTQEVYDVVNYLRSLLSSRDDVALLGFLRSPFFAISDVELYRISRQPNQPDAQNDLWSRCFRWASMPEATEPLKRAVQTLEDDRSMASRLPVSLLLKRIIERTGWRGAILGAERGEQMLANLDKLIDMVREFEERGFTNLFDFVERVSAQIESEDLESEASMNSSRNAVRLMTMHGAKGLEFPVVILPDLATPTRVSTPPFFDKELGFGWNWTFNGSDYRPMITALMKMRRREKERAEEARIFYVALTRARDVLILTGECEDEPSANTMLDWALAPLPTLSDNKRISLPQTLLKFLEKDGKTITSQNWEQEVTVRRQVVDLKRYKTDGEFNKKFGVDFLQISEISARARGEIYYATQFLTYSQCPTKYYLRYRLGIPETLGSAWEIDPTASDSEDGTTLARLFRESLRALAVTDRLATDYEAKKIVSVVERLLALEPMDAVSLEQVKGRLLKTLERILTSTSVTERLRPEGSTLESMKELRIPLGTKPNREFILGVMDALVKATDGTRSFIQFKTLRLSDRDPASIAESYLPQLRLYAWLMSKLSPTQRSITGTILFTEAPDEPQDFTFNKFDLLRTEEEITSTIEDIRSLSYTGRRQLPLKTPHCTLCPYWIEQKCLLGRE